VTLGPLPLRRNYAASVLTIDGVEGCFKFFLTGFVVLGMQTLGQNCIIAGISSE